MYILPTQCFSVCLYYFSLQHEICGCNTELNWNETLRNPAKLCSQIVTWKQADKNCTDFWNIFASLKNYPDCFLWSYVYQSQHVVSVIRASTMFSGHRKVPDIYDDLPGWLTEFCHALEVRSYIAVWQDSHTASLNHFWGQPLQTMSLLFKFLSWGQYKKRPLLHSACVSLFWTLDS